MFINKSNLKNWLFYWRNCLADADRKAIDPYTNPVIVPQYYIERVPKDIAKELWHRVSNNSNDDPIDIVIAPCLFRHAYMHAKSKSKDDTTLYPFWITAQMSKDGMLIPSEKPFFVRDYLNLNPEDSYKIAEIAVVDEYLQRADFCKTDWKKYWTDCEMFFQAVTKETYESYNTGIEKKLFIEIGDKKNLSKNILDLYDDLINDRDEHPLLEAITSIKTSKTKNYPEHIESCFNVRHLGQMSPEFPLSKSQRESFCAFKNTDQHEILAVNGPPGTGKTTLLQSVVANSVVTSVIENRPSELIMASSANNQAITNILESFELKESSEYSSRWLPEIESLGAYFSSKEPSKYHLFKNTFGDGFLQQYESSEYESKVEFFKTKFTTHFGSFVDIEACSQSLLMEVKTIAEKIKEHLNSAKEYQSIESELAELGFKSHQELNKRIIELQEKIVLQDTVLEKLHRGEKKLSLAKKNLPLLDKLFFFLRANKERRTLKYQRALVDLKITENIDFSRFNLLVSKIDELVVSESAIKSDLEDKFKNLSKANLQIQTIANRYYQLIHSWNAAYPNKLDELIIKTGREYKDLDPLEDMAVRLDMSYRFEAFWLAVHYRESEYLIKLKSKLETDRHGKERAKTTYQEKLRRFACIFPVFISTFFSLPRFSSYFRDGSEHVYYGLYDLLIVDEAGQVAPDVSVPSFSLAQKAIIVGDLFQIEPIWSIDQKIDACNLKLAGLWPQNNLEGFTENLHSRGFLSSTGSLMKLAQNCCSYEIAGMRGVLLREHRRCLDQIISYSNCYVYKNQLIPKKGREQTVNHGLPAKGFLHINSVSAKSGNSRRNVEDAEVIVRWINNESERLERVYKKKIYKIIAIVTPYRTQATLIKQKLRSLNAKKFARITVGTVHVLQGAEKDIVIFSLVLSVGNNTSFINRRPNMLNVAVSRARHSFLVFGNMNVLRSDESSPLGYLKKWLLEEKNCDLPDSIVYENDRRYSNSVKRINTLDLHRKYLKRAFEKVESELIIVSPYISINAIENDDIIRLAHSAFDRKVLLTVYTDSQLDKRSGQINKNSDIGRKALIDSGIDLKIVKSIHNKTLIIDNDKIVEGSFNWLSASRDKSSPYHRHEVSIYLQGDEAKKQITKAKKELKDLEKQ